MIWLFWLMDSIVSLSLSNSFGLGPEDKDESAIEKVGKEPTEAELGLAVHKAKKEMNKDLKHQWAVNEIEKHENIRERVRRKLRERGSALAFMNDLRNPLLVEPLSKRMAKMNQENLVPPDKSAKEKDTVSPDHDREKLKSAKLDTKPVDKSDLKDLTKDELNKAKTNSLKESPLQIKKLPQHPKEDPSDASILSQISDHNLSENNIKNKILVDSQTLPSIVPTEREKDATTTNNPVVVKYLARPEQLQELMRH